MQLGALQSGLSFGRGSGSVTSSAAPFSLDIQGSALDSQKWVIMPLELLTLCDLVLLYRLAYPWRTDVASL